MKKGALSLVKEKKLTKKENEILRIAFYFKFISVKNIADYFNHSDHSTARRQLRNLYKKGYMKKNYTSEYVRHNRFADYYLTTNSIPWVKEYIYQPSEREIKQIYARSKASMRFIERSLGLFDIFLEFKRLYGERADYVTKPQLDIADYSFLPTPLPDAFVSLDVKTRRERQFFVEYFDDALPIGIHARRLVMYKNYLKSGEWNITGLEFPVIIIVTESHQLLEKTARRIRYLDRHYPDEIGFRVIALGDLKCLKNSLIKGWSDPLSKNHTSL